MDRKLDQLKINLPDGMRPALKARAAHNRRSMSSELILILERALREEKAAGEGPRQANPAAEATAAATNGN